MPEGVGFPFPSLHLNEGRTYGQPEVVRISLPQVATGLRLRLPGSFRRRAFARATSQADMLACPFDDCRGNQQIYLLVHADLLMPREALFARGAHSMQAVMHSALLRRGRSDSLLPRNQRKVLPEINAGYGRKEELDDGDISFYSKDCRTE